MENLTGQGNAQVAKPQQTQEHLFGKPLATTVFDNTLIGQPSTVQLETRIAAVATEEVVCIVKDKDVKKAKEKADKISTAVNEYPALKLKEERHDKMVKLLEKFLKYETNSEWRKEKEIRASEASDGNMSYMDTMTHEAEALIEASRTK